MVMYILLSKCLENRQKEFTYWRAKCCGKGAGPFTPALWYHWSTFPSSVGTQQNRHGPLVFSIH